MIYLDRKPSEGLKGSRRVVTELQHSRHWISLFGRAHAVLLNDRSIDK